MAGPTDSATETSVNVDTVRFVKQVFNNADTDGGHDLDIDEFCRAFVGKLETQDGSDEDAIRKLFYRIDANADGAVDWDEFSMYMLLENLSAASIRQNEATRLLVRPELPGKAPPQEAHRRMTNCLSHIPPCGGVAHRYATGGRDGLVKLWDGKDLSLSRTINTGNSWVTGVKYMPTFRCLAVTTYARSLTMYDISSPFCTTCGSIPKMDSIPLAMDIFTPPGVRNADYVAIGDAAGQVHLHAIKPHTKHNHFQELAEFDGRKGRQKAIDKYQEEMLWSKLVHSKWVTKLMYVPDLQQLISSSLDGTLWAMDVERRSPFVKLEGNVNGVFCCDWSDRYKVVVSCGADKKLMLFNPYSGRRHASFIAHSATVTDVAVNDADNQIISLAADKTIKVWDIRNYKCLQTLVDREVYHPDDVISGMLFDRRQQHLVTGNLQLKVWPLRSVAAAGAGAHAHPVACVLYNRIFGDAVSGDQAGTVCVWNTKTGKLRSRFTNTHGDGAAITSMAFDALHRRLITGCDRGTCKAWNFSSGACLKEMTSTCSRDVTGIVCTCGKVTRCIIACGWDKKITFYEDGAERRVVSTRSIAGHSADILAAALMDMSPTLVTAASDGELMVWNIESGTLRRKLVPPRPQALPASELAQEVLAFLHGRLSHVVAAVGCEQVVRFWDVLNGNLLLEFHTGHILRESVIALAFSPDNCCMATGDSAGVVRTWHLRDFVASVPTSSSCIVSAAIWRAHMLGVSSLAYLDAPAHMLLSSGYDNRVCLWAHEGALVGCFGTHTWSIADKTTWQSSSVADLAAEDAARLARTADTGACANGASAIHTTLSCATSAAASGQPEHRQRWEAWEHVDTLRIMQSDAKAAQESVAALLGRPSLIAEGGASPHDTDSSDDAAEDADVPESMWMDEYEEAHRASATPAGPCAREVALCVASLRAHKGALSHASHVQLDGRPASSGRPMSPMERRRRQMEYQPSSRPATPSN